MRKLLLVVLLIQGVSLSQTGNGVIEGRVRAANGTPIAGLVVGAMPGSATAADAVLPIRNTARATTDSNGSYRLEKIPPGNYVIFALGSPVSFYPGVQLLANAMAITVKPNSNIVGIDFTASTQPVSRATPRPGASPAGPGVKVSGRVLLASGAPPFRGNVTMRAPPTGSTNAQIQPDGTFEFSGVQPGNYMAEYRSANVVASQQITVANADLIGIELVDLDWVRNAKGLEQVWSLNGKYSGVVWDVASGVIHASNGAVLVDVDESGKILQQIPFRSSPNLRLAHFAKQGTVLLLFGTWSTSVDAYDLTGTLIWSYAVGAIDDVWAKDLDGDGSDEVIVGFNGRVGLHVLDSSGAPLWQDTSIGNVWHVTSADVRGEGKPQVIGTSAAGQVHVFSTDGKQRTDLMPGFFANMIRTGKMSAADTADTLFVAGSGGGASSPVLAAFAGDGTKKWSLETVGAKSVNSAYLAPGRPWLALGMQGGQVQIVDCEHGTVIASIDGQGFDPEMTWVSERDAAPLLIIATGNKLGAYRVRPGN